MYNFVDIFRLEVFLILKDRGIVKWQAAAFLPEHKQMLKEYEAEQNLKPRIELDIQKLEEMNKVVCEAMEYNRELCFFYFKNGEYCTVKGHIHYLEPIRKELRVMDKLNQLYILKIQDILDIELL